MSKDVDSAARFFLAQILKNVEMMRCRESAILVAQLIVDCTVGTNTMSHAVVSWDALEPVLLESESLLDDAHAAVRPTSISATADELMFDGYTSAIAPEWHSISTCGNTEVDNTSGTAPQRRARFWEVHDSGCCHH